MGGFDEYKPAMAMFGLQFSYAGVALSTRAALLQGMSPSVFVFYRQAIATLVIAPFAYFTSILFQLILIYFNNHIYLVKFCYTSFFYFIFLNSVAINQNIYFQGLLLSSSSMASAMANLVPAITFLIASIFGLEKVNIRSLRSLAKILGTIVCVSGAMSMALVKGPKLLNLPNNNDFVLESNMSSSSNDHDDWILGCIFLFGAYCCWSTWLILQYNTNFCQHKNVLAKVTFLVVD
ncbi:WAT1-related protein At4g30420-like [Cannabis sativa]|uniref:WAT1-related protein At4g30420-like n=1 Tax=Cannabis sativa TaxID=3483 RepID=UPI0029CA78A2|nr:WAT1-related protein At4g30420-like [Cannabis sativa]